MDIANAIMREAWRPKTDLIKMTPRAMSDIRYAIAQSKRYSLDGSMSEFLAALSTVPFDVAPERRADVLASMRHSARLPFRKTFIQIDGLAFRRGLLKYATNSTDPWGKTLVHEDGHIKWPGLLLEQLDDETIQITYFCELPLKNDELSVITLPYVYLYKTNDVPLPDSFEYDFVGGSMSHGVYLHGQDRTVAVKHYYPLTNKHGINVEKDDEIIGRTHHMVIELCGLVRYVFAFLATLNDIPTITTEVRPSKGYFARGQHRKYLDHTVLTLSLPRKSTLKTLARRLIAMARKRWHEVEPHWRINKKPNGFVCEPSYKHLWSARDDKGHSYCATCEARRVWIVLPRGRGDPNLGIVRHNEITVTHSKT